MGKSVAPTLYPEKVTFLYGPFVKAKIRGGSNLALIIDNQWVGLVAAQRNAQRAAPTENTESAHRRGQHSLSCRQPLHSQIKRERFFRSNPRQNRTLIACAARTIMNQCYANKSRCAPGWNGRQIPKSRFASKLKWRNELSLG